MPVLVVSRQGLHTVLLIGTFVVQIRMLDLTIGVVSGLVLAGLAALAVTMAQLLDAAVQNLANASYS